MRDRGEASAPLAFGPDERLDGMRVTVMGLGLFGGGAGVAEYFARRGASVVVTDLKRREALEESVTRLDAYPIEWRLGVHEERDFVATDLVVKNPAVQSDAAWLRVAREHGVPVESEITIFFRFCRAPITAITGSNGKTTTTRLAGAILERCGRRTFVGGNVGGSILLRRDEIEPDDAVVLELSSFQGEDLDRAGLSPARTIVLNLTPNHLDRHGTMRAYAQAKQALLRHQGEDDVAILSFDDPVVREWGEHTQGRVLGFSVREPLDSGFFVRDGEFVAALDGTTRSIMRADEMRLLGEFNRANALAAMAPALLDGGNPKAVADAVREFRGVEHRLEHVGDHEGVRYYNDSIATTPESTLAALSAVPGRKWVIVGGYDKGLPLDGLVAALRDRATGVAAIGQSGPAITASLRALDFPVSRLASCGELESALAWIAERSTPGDAVLLSPAYASYDQFANFAERGRRFREWVGRQAATSGTPSEARGSASTATPGTGRSTEIDVQ